jgi:hypothetical protein
MTRLAGHDLYALQITLDALVSWKHDRVEIVILCCNLLQRVAKYTVEQPLVRSIVYLLCRIAFRHPVHGIRTQLDPLNLRTIDKLHSFIQDGDEDFIGDLMSFFAYVSWSEGLEGHILQAILRIPEPGLSTSSQAAIITMLGTARWSLVERFGHKSLVDFVGRLPTDMVVERIVGDGSVCIGLMRILLFFTFHPPPGTDTRPLWKVLLPMPLRVPHFFSRDLPSHVETSFADFSRGHDSEIYEKKEEASWMKLFWSSRFFEMDCRPWTEFKAATDGLRQLRPALLQQLEKLCFGLEEEAQVSPDSATARTKAYTEMSKLLGGVHAPRPPQGADSPQVPRMNPTRQNQNATAGDTQSGPDPFAVAPRDTPPVSPTTRRQNSILSQIQDSFPPPPTSSTEPAASIPQPPLPPSQARSESPVPVITMNEGDQQSVPVQSGSGAGQPPDAGPRSARPPVLPDRGDDAGSLSGLLPPANDEGDGSH